MSKQERGRGRGPKKQLKRVGYFRELSHGDPNGPSLAESRRDEATAEEAHVLDYLRQGVPCIVSPGPVWDAVDDEGPIGTASVLTDGEWAWPDDAAHYVAKYHVLLPEEFVAHARGNHWRVPEISDEDLATLTLT